MLGCTLSATLEGSRGWPSPYPGRTTADSALPAAAAPPPTAWGRFGLSRSVAIHLPASNVSAEAHDVFAQFVAGWPHAYGRLGLVEAIPDRSDACEIARQLEPLAAQTRGTTPGSEAKSLDVLHLSRTGWPRALPKKRSPRFTRRFRSVVSRDRVTVVYPLSGAHYQICNCGVL
jgi:hypothetical protein